MTAAVDREAVARIIDPWAFDPLRAAGGMFDRRNADDRKVRTLAKADLILALTDARVGELEGAPVAWMVSGAGAHMLMHNEPRNGVAPGLTVTPLYAAAPRVGAISDQSLPATDEKQ